MVAVYSIAHFLVDFASAFLMFRAIAQAPDWYLYVMLYNFCAFAMQMPLGILADELNRNSLFATVGCILVGVAYGFWHIPLAGVIVVGIGNAMFHIGGGVDILNISEKKSAALGVFVSPGTFGIYFGTIFGRGGGAFAIPILLALFVAVGLILAIQRVHRGAYASNASFSLVIGVIHKMLFIGICLFSVVCLRSFVGLTLNFPWRITEYWGLALVCASAFGKTAGGFVADRFGFAKTALFSLGISAPLFLFPQIPLLGVAAVFLFNMTMPITLWAMAKTFPGAKGFSFGLLTVALFLGFVPVHLGVNIPSGMPWLFAIATAISLVLLLVGLRKAKL